MQTRGLLIFPSQSALKGERFFISRKEEKPDHGGTSSCESHFKSLGELRARGGCRGHHGHTLPVSDSWNARELIPSVVEEFPAEAFRHAQTAVQHTKKLGAFNTICFDGDILSGFNTDFTGFLKSYQNIRGNQPAGNVLLIGAGGVGRSVAFALLELGVSKIWLFDKNPERACQLSDALNRQKHDIARKITGKITGDLPEKVNGIVNCSPAGMYGYDSLPLSQSGFPAYFDWAFDAVYQPVETSFKKLATARQAEFISGFDLFFWQGVDAFRIFTGQEIKDAASLRLTLFEKVHHSRQAGPPNKV